MGAHAFVLLIFASLFALIEANIPSDFNSSSLSSPYLNLTYPRSHPLARLGCREHDPMLEAAFSPWWDRKLDPSVWEETCQATSSMSQAYWARIVDGRLEYSSCSHGAEQDEDLNYLFGVILDLIRDGELPDTEFTFNTGDQPLSDRSYYAPTPQLHWVRSAGHWTIPIPNPFQLRALWMNQLGDNWAEIQGTHSPWDKRSSRVYWRGSLSLPDNTNWANLHATPRIRLMRLAKQRPELFDVGITNTDKDVWWDNLSLAHQNQLTQLLKKSHRSWEPFGDVAPKHKFVINLSAVLSSWRLVQLLSTGAVLLLQWDSNHELLSGYLEPWVHFVPLRFGLSDVITKLEYLRRRDDVAQRIAAAGFEFFKQNVRREDTYCYMDGVLRGLRNLVNGSSVGTESKGRKFVEVHREEVFGALQKLLEPEEQLEGLREVLAKTPAPEASPQPDEL